MENIVIKTEPEEYDSDSEEADSMPFPETIIPDVETDSNSCEVDNVKIKTEIDPGNIKTEIGDSSLEIKTAIEDSSLEESTELSNEYCFESDHPALKANSDYKNLIQTITILETQRCKAIKDLDKLYELQNEALSDPIAFVERLQRKEDLNIPGPQMIQPVPVIDWSKYSLSSTASAFGRRQLTRLSAKMSQDLTKSSILSKGKPGSFSEQQKSQRASQYWSIEEQKRLEELLIQFPPEEVETRRWEKIANCLENRTPIQVASRVQKYFIKLMRAGIPIPGRTPSTAYLKKARRNIIRQQPSTFLVSHTLPVYMPEAEEDYSQTCFIPQSFDNIYKDIKMEISDDEEVDPELKDTQAFQEFKLLRKILKEKLKNCGLAEHVGYKCSRCKAAPIIGVRWHCTVCKPPVAIDFCDDCVESKYETENHTIDHKLEEIPNANSGFSESDYSSFMECDYNYLDPNYMPVT